MIRKHIAKFGSQWDKYLAGVVWAYRNTPHEATQEKPSMTFLLFGAMCMHLDSHCVCTVLYEVLGTMCVHVLCTSVQPLL